MSQDMRELVDKLNNYAYHYYVLDNPIISDKEYDLLYDELIKLENQTGVILDDSPTRRIGGEPITKFGTHKHIVKLYSLDKVQSIEELKNWYNRIVKTLKGEKPLLTVEHKMDGLTLCLTYKNRQYVRATTRGNGEKGEDVTEQVRSIKGFPLKIEYDGTIEVQGEGIMRTSVFNKYNKTAKEPLKNPRNGTAGAIRNLDPKITASRNLDIYFYNVNYFEGNLISTQTDMMEFLKANRFKTSHYSLNSTIDEVIESVNNIDRAQLDYAIDGLVVKVNDLKLREKLGYTDKFPRWAVAYKFEAEETTTIINDVTWQVGRTGKLTPLALLEPVELAGATISRATLNNIGDIERKSVRKGSRVFIRRSNDVIPEITGLAETYPTDIAIVIPPVCPSCKKPLEEIGAHIFCVNFVECPAQIKGRLEHFVSKECIDIEGVSEQTVEQLYEKLNIKSPADLFDLTKEDLLKLEGFKDKKADNFINAINFAKGRSLASFINALAIPNVGKKTAKDLADKYQSITALMSSKEEELTQLDEIGEVIASSIVCFFDKHKDYVLTLNDLVKPIYEKKRAMGALSQKKFVVTGTLTRYKRSQAHKLIEDKGGIVSDTVTRDTDYLVVGKDAGSKLQKAQELGIKIINEDEFSIMIE